VHILNSEKHLEQEVESRSQRESSLNRYAFSKIHTSPDIYKNKCMNTRKNRLVDV
jgi:hypothetical protein